MFALAAAALTAISCTKDDELPAKIVDQAIVGEWHLVSTTVEGESVSETADVYLTITEYGRFELYQKYPSQLRYTLYTGTCWSEGELLKGEYSDGTPWATYTTYFVGEKLALKTYDLMEVMTFEKKSLSDEQKAEANVWTKSATDGYSPIL